jgi:hypothetical protein
VAGSVDGSVFVVRGNECLTARSEARSRQPARPRRPREPAGRRPTGVAPDQPALQHLSPTSPPQLRVMDVRRPAGQTIAQQAAAELACVGQLAAAHPAARPLTQPGAHPPARHSTETMPEASNPHPVYATGALHAKENTEPTTAEWTGGHPAVELRARHVAAQTSTGHPQAGAGAVQHAVEQVDPDAWSWRRTGAEWSAGATAV